MWIQYESLLFGATLLTLSTGLACMIGMALCRNPKRQAHCHHLFYLALVALGLVTLLAVGSDSGIWMGPGTGLSAMTVGATLDLRADRAVRQEF